MRTQILHLSGPRRGEQQTYPQPLVRIGSASGADLELPELAARHAEIEFVPDECCFYLRAREGKVFLNQREVREVILEHGDLLELGTGGPKLRFKVQAVKGETCKPVRHMLLDARDSRALRGWRAFLASLVRDIHNRTPLRVKVAFPILVAGATVVAAYAGGWLGGRRQHDEIERLRSEFAARARVVDELVERNAALQRVLHVYSLGVCLVHGSFGFERTAADGSRQDLTGARGDPLRIEYTGSGFLARAGGWIVSNRHVVEPWWNNENHQSLMQIGWRPHFFRLAVVFPGQAPVPVDPATVRVRADDADVAVFRAEVQDVPVLPLFDGDLAPLRGGHVVVLGYPTGINALLAKAPPEVAREITGAGLDLTGMIDALSGKGAITPVATQGALNEVTARQLIYDASTTSGGSGGPVFGTDGRVIGVNFAILAEFGGTNFGVPIGLVREILP
jgi:S1-C subfamily serine protease